MELRGRASLCCPALRADQKSEWGLFLFHPDTLLATTEDRVIWYRIQPLGPDRIKLLTTTLVAPEVLEQPNSEEVLAEQAEMLYAFHLEDMEVCTAVQRGLRSAPSIRGGSATSRCRSGSSTATLPPVSAESGPRKIARRPPRSANPDFVPLLHRQCSP